MKYEMNILINFPNVYAGTGRTGTGRTISRLTTFVTLVSLFTEVKFVEQAYFSEKTDLLM